MQHEIKKKSIDDGFYIDYFKDIFKANTYVNLYMMFIFSRICYITIRAVSKNFKYVSDKAVSLSYCISWCVKHPGLYFCKKHIEYQDF